MAMQLGSDLLCALPIAVAEAKTYGWREIEPHHMLGAILKIAGLQKDKIHALVEHDLDLSDFSSAHDGLVEVLQVDFGLEIPTQTEALRRALRVSGNDNVGGDEILHRSQDTRSLFNQGETIAANENRNALRCSDLVSVSLSQPVGVIASAMQKLNLGSNPKEEISQLESMYPNILRPIAPMSEVPQDENERFLKAALKVIADHVLGKSRSTRPCLLINSGHRLDETITRCLEGTTLNSREIIQIDSQAFLELTARSKAKGNLTSLFQDIWQLRSQRFVFYFESFHRYLIPELAGSEGVKRLPACIASLDQRVLFGTSERHFRERILGKPEWRKIFREVWLHDRAELTQL